MNLYSWRPERESDSPPAIWEVVVKCYAARLPIIESAGDKYFLCPRCVAGQVNLNGFRRF